MICSMFSFFFVIISFFGLICFPPFGYFIKASYMSVPDLVGSFGFLIVGGSSGGVAGFYGFLTLWDNALL